MKTEDKEDSQEQKDEYEVVVKGGESAKIWRERWHEENKIKRLWSFCRFFLLHFVTDSLDDDLHSSPDWEAQPPCTTKRSPFSEGLSLDWTLLVLPCEVAEALFVLVTDTFSEGDKGICDWYQSRLSSKVSRISWASGWTRSAHVSHRGCTMKSMKLTCKMETKGI